MMKWGFYVCTGSWVKKREGRCHGDNRIKVCELQAFVVEQVQQLTNGGQDPTAHRENLEYDFAVY